MGTETQRYAWTCPDCLKRFRVKLGHNPEACPDCMKRRTYRSEELIPEPPEWLRKRPAGQAAFLPHRPPRTPPAEPYAPSVHGEEHWREKARPRSSVPPFVMLLLGVAGVFALLTSLLARSIANSAGATVPLHLAALMAIIGMGAAALYFLPTIIAVYRKHHNAVPIGIVNLCFGWTFVGYVAALAWAFTAIPDRQGRTT